MKKLIFLLALSWTVSTVAQDIYVEYHYDTFEQEETLITTEIQADASVTPTVVVGGVKEKVHIHRPEGGFGEKNRLQWGPTNVYSSSYYIEQWTDTDIIAEVPSNARSGVITITTLSGVEYTTNNITVRYGLYTVSGQVEDGYQWYRPVHIAQNGEGGVTFHFGTGMSQSLKDLVKRCAAKWIGFNIKFSNEDLDIHAHTTNDGINIITIGTSPGAASVSTAYKHCGNNEFYYFDQDMVLDERRDEEAITHEFGHILGLTHQYNGKSVMGPSGGNGGDPGDVDIEASTNSLIFSAQNPVPCFPSMDIGILDSLEVSFFTKAIVVKYIDLLGRIYKEKTYLADGIYIVEYEYEGVIARRLEIVKSNW